MATHNENSSEKFQDRILRPEFNHLRLRFSQGSTWVRILPALRDSAFDWHLPIQVLDFPGGRFVHPATFDWNKLSVYDVALKWFRRNDPQSLYSRVNRLGYRLQPEKLCVFWAVEYSDQGTHSLRLLLESFSDGAKGPIGLAREIHRKVFEKDENGQRMGNALTPDSGAMICVDRQIRRHPHSPLDWVRLGRIPTSVDEMLKQVRQEESDLLRPLEEVLQHVTIDQQWDYLGRLISPELAEHIRSNPGHWF